jgi:hypothetical protein
MCRLTTILLAGLFLSPGFGRAGSVIYTYNTTTPGYTKPTSDGDVSAQATFTTFTGLTVGTHTYSGIEIQIQNLELLKGNNGEGQAISGITFSLGSPLGSSSNALVQDQGPEVTTIKSGGLATGPTLVTGTSSSTPKPFLHWGSSASSSGLTLETAGPAAQGGAHDSPTHLIIGGLGGGGSYNSSYQQHDPSFYQTATFWIADANVTSNTALTTSNIFNVKFAFGTGPAFGALASGQNGPTPQSPTPEPSSLVLFAGIAGLGLTAGWYRRGRAGSA